MFCVDPCIFLWQIFGVGFSIVASEPYIQSIAIADHQVNTKTKQSGEEDFGGGGTRYPTSVFPSVVFILVTLVSHFLLEKYFCYFEYLKL